MVTTATDEIDPLMMRASTRVGTTIRGKWHLDALLGVGGMASVYAATHRNTQRAALKILHPELSLHAEVRSRFFREGRTSNIVNHPGAVRVLDEDTAEDGSVFLVMELLDGESLAGRGTFPRFCFSMPSSRSSPSSCELPRARSTRAGGGAEERGRRYGYTKSAIYLIRGPTCPSTWPGERVSAS